MFNYTIKFTSIISLSLVLFSCGNENTDDIDEIPVEESTTTASADTHKVSAQNVFNTLPNRQIVLDIITESKAEYDPNLLNNPDDVAKYSTETSKALNFGVFGADLNVTSVFEQTQESILFLKCVNVLAKNLGVNNVFDEKMMNRMDANRDNRDSTMTIVSESFRKTDEFLVTNNRPSTSSLIVAGAWVEGMYIACATTKKSGYGKSIRVIFEQKKSLNYLVELLVAAKANEKVDYLITDLKKIETICSSKPDNNYTISDLTKLDVAITALRLKIVSSI